VNSFAASACLYSQHVTDFYSSSSFISAVEGGVELCNELVGLIDFILKYILLKKSEC
jgi:hypothetical protein